MLYHQIINPALAEFPVKVLWHLRNFVLPGIHLINLRGGWHMYIDVLLKDIIATVGFETRIMGSTI